MHLSAFASSAIAALVAIGFGAAVPAAATAVPRAPANNTTKGLLALAADNSPPLTFNYATSQPDSQNWVGIWDSYYGGPDNETYIENSWAWNWATAAKGSVKVDVSKLQPGTYKAYYLAKNGYKWLADPIQVVVPGTGPLRFLVKEFKTQNARRGDKFTAVIRGLLANPSSNMTYSIADRDNADWLSISNDGTITGTPSASGNTKFTIVASSSDGSTPARLPVVIPVVASKAPLVTNLKVLTFNIWQGGHNVNDYHRKQVSFLSEIDADVVGMQESFFHDGLRLAQALGWYSWQSKDVSIISRYPISQVFPEAEAGGAVKISVDGNDSELIMWNAHLGYDPYGPYDFCFSKYDRDTVLKREAQSGRTPQIIEIMDRMKSQIANANDVPVILTGDFNAPSHLDWTNATAKDHCGVGAFPWPSSVYPTEGGLVDSYREKFPDPVVMPGITWSPIYKNNGGKPEPMDRIDFIYHKGMKTVDSKVVVVGNPTAEPNHKNNEWPSDHAAVLTTFKIPNKRCKRATKA